MGFLDAAQKAAEPTVVELTAFLDDDKKAAVKCRPLVSIDYFSVQSDGFNAIPILTGTKQVDELDVEERLKMYGWMREIVKKAVVAVRDIRDGQSVWQPVVMNGDDMEAPTLDEHGKLHISVRMLEALNEGTVADIAGAIINRTNTSREMEVAKRGSK